ncbi:histidine kinase dimerization/phosphoacceptor domain -containing protein [Fulvimarina sp. 2208YS6-2-32]|uniref:histidine kinase n=1 Tax=Fulvimarina uroteuthidis TaxID=3098149 RepID=A0ABU5I5X7_9HYPH|nr:histidine kinase dimerization/phosphoacceptor domain -containing protein [Fulvimarina sp. 2208YS6-2-32]MDY8110779.1 histidine kinase dimerization/phosphoacceptor domain -containing protein [Fulvimarina sp. 2208YS6-2-32]
MKSVVTSISLELDGDVTHTRRSALLIAKVAQAPSRDQIRFATAVSEIARNAYQYGENGVAEFSFNTTSRGVRLLARVHDRGHGIRDVDAMLRGRHQSHKGPGLGLSGSQKLVDDFVINTSEAGTIVELALNLKTVNAPVDLARTAAEALVTATHGSPVEELSEQNRALRDALAEQQFLLREMHHRTKNNLAIIQSLALMQARRSEHAETRRALNDLTGRIQAFANAHNLLHRADDVTHVDIREHIETLTERLRVALAQSGLAIETEGPPLLVSFDTATELGLIINELVTNAAKHAPSTNDRNSVVTITAARVGTKIRLTVADNGIGLANAEETLRASKSLGWKIIEGCVRKLNGSIAVDGSAGLVVDVEFDQGPF